MYISPPLIVSFNNTRQISQVNITLPRLGNEKESITFDACPVLNCWTGMRCRFR